MSQKDTNFKANADAFVKSLMDMAKDMQENLINLQKQDESIVLDFEKLNAEANEKVKELNKELNSLHNKIKGL